MTKLAVVTDLSSFNLADWQNNQRSFYKRGQLPKDRIKMLESLSDWTWSINDTAWEKGYQYTLKYGLVSSKYSCPDGYGLGRWQHKERGTCTDPVRRARLEQIPDWAWSRREQAWNRGFAMLKKYGMQQQDYVTPCGYKLGSWISAQRQKQKDPKKRNKLKSIKGWYWRMSNKERVSKAVKSRMSKTKKMKRG